MYAFASLDYPESIVRRPAAILSRTAYSNRPADIRRSKAPGDPLPRLRVCRQQLVPADIRQSRPGTTRAFANSQQRPSECCLQRNRPGRNLHQRTAKGPIPEQEPSNATLHESNGTKREHTTNRYRGVRNIVTPCEANPVPRLPIRTPNETDKSDLIEN
jgi:hypothetical protein